MEPYYYGIFIDIENTNHNLCNKQKILFILKEKIIDFIITISISVTPLHVHNDAQLVLLVACAYHYQNILNFHFIIKI